MSTGSGRPAAGLVAATAVLAISAGCGGSGAAGSQRPTQDGAGSARAAKQCRHQWQQLGEQIAGRADRTDPSALAGRWTAVSATVQYYVVNATGSDCDSALSQQRAAVKRVSAFSAKLRKYDLGHRRAKVSAGALDYLSRHSAGKDPKGKAPSTRKVHAALATLRRELPTSVSDLEAGWHEADSVDLTDARARHKVLSDLAFLAHGSAAFQQCRRALALLRRAGDLARGAPG